MPSRLPPQSFSSPAIAEDDVNEDDITKLRLVVIMAGTVDAFDEARKLGLEASQAADFSHDAEGVTESFYAVSRSAAHLRRLPGRAAKIRAKDVLLDEVRREREAEGRL